MFRLIRPRAFLPWIQDLIHRVDHEKYHPLLDEHEKPVELHGVDLPIGNCERYHGVKAMRGTKWFLAHVDGTIYGPYDQERDAAKAYVRGLILQGKDKSIPAYTHHVWNNVLKGNDRFDNEQGLPLWKNHVEHANTYAQTIGPRIHPMLYNNAYLRHQIP